MILPFVNRSFFCGDSTALSRAIRRVRRLQEQEALIRLADEVPALRKVVERIEARLVEQDKGDGGKQVRERERVE